MKVILAPMATLSHSGLRRLIHDFMSPDEYLSEMIHAPSLNSGGHLEKWYIRNGPVPEKLVWQLTSPTAESLIQAVPLVLGQGGMGIDINMGCCAPAIVQTGAGFAWRGRPLTEVAELIRGVKKSIATFESQTERAVQKKLIRLSVKLRIGEEFDYEGLQTFCAMLVNEGVQLITLHPRIKKQKYNRPARHEFTARLAKDISIPVYGNGDVSSFSVYQGFSKDYPCAGWMLGRSAIQKPWIFKEIALKERGEESIKVDLLDVGMKFLSYLREEQPPEFWKTRAQRFFYYFCDNVSFSHYIKTKILNADSLELIEKNLISYFDEVPSERYTSC